MDERIEVCCSKCGFVTIVDPDACSCYGWPKCCGETMIPRIGPMRIVIAGSRSITDYELVRKAIEDSGFLIDVVISGGARGVDRIGEEWAQKNGKPINRFLPDWERYGKSAGFIRNDLMIRNADGAIFVYDGTSRGTAHTISLAKRKGIPTYILDTSKETPDGKEEKEDRPDQEATGPGV